MTTFSTRAASVAGGAIGLATRLRRVNPLRLRQLLGRVELAAHCVRDVAGGRYPHVPWKTVSALAAALAYFVAPVDAVPDFVPFSGLLDDAAVLSLVFGAAESDLRRYCAWRGTDPGPYFDATESRAA